VAVLAVLLPVGILGLIFWSAVGVRQRHVESVTPASLTSFYARVLSIVRRPVKAKASRLWRALTVRQTRGHAAQRARQHQREEPV